MTVAMGEGGEEEERMGRLLQFPPPIRIVDDRRGPDRSNGEGGAGVDGGVDELPIVPMATTAQI